MADVLVVEDHVDSGQAIVAALESAGHAVRHALDGQAALTALLQRPPHLIVLDVRLPGMDGCDFLAVLRSYLRWREIPVVVVSAASDAEVERAQAHGVQGVFRKAHFQLEHLLESIGQILKQRGT